MPRYARSACRELVYRAAIPLLVLGRVRAVDVAREYDIPPETVRSWKHAFIKKSGGIENARIRAEQILMVRQSSKKSPVDNAADDTINTE